MKKILLLGALSLFSMGLQAQRKFKITLDEARNGSYTVSPKLPKDGIVKRGTTLTISATANEGYIPDGGYYATIQDGYVQYHETMQSSFKVKVDKEMNIGYSFVPKETEENLRVIQDIVYAKPGVKALKYDIYAPKGKDRLPCIIIIHGGGWSSNSEEVMRVYGAVIHITENAAMYGGDSNNIFLTGDSAGGHLAASVANFVERLGDKGFNKIENTFQFAPTYMPKGKSIEEIKQKLAQSIKGVAPSYGVFSMQMLSQRFADYPFLKEVAPINYIPEGRAVPYFLLRGTEDQLIKNEEVESYAKALIKAGQRVEYLQVGGANHAFLDWKPDEETQETFSKYGKYCTKHMLLFFDNILGK